MDSNFARLTPLPAIAPDDLNAAINLRLALLGLPCRRCRGRLDHRTHGAHSGAATRTKPAGRPACPVDTRIQNFLNAYLADVGSVPHLPGRTLVLDQAGPGCWRLSLPANGDFFKSPLIESSYRLRNGVLHNPANDRRTTAGVFHVVEGGLPVPDDKLAVPKVAFAKLLDLALSPPTESLQLPFTAGEPTPARCFVCIAAAPARRAGGPGFTTAKYMETRFFVPGGPGSQS